MRKIEMKKISKTKMEKNFFFAPLASGLGATRRAAMLLLVMMLTTATAWAQDPGQPWQCGDNLTWELNGKTLTISGTGAMYDYDDVMNPTPWSSYAAQINEVVIEDGVTSIGIYAFSRTAMTSIEIPASVTSIGESAFFECESLTSVTFAEGSQLESIGNDVFDDTGLTSIEIPASVTSIGAAAFYDCQDLTSVTFAEGSQLESIGNNAFQNCHNLTSITIPASVTSIGSSVFQDCVYLASMAVADGNTVYDSRNGCNAIIETLTNKLIYGCSNSTIPTSVTSIGDRAFHNCSYLTSITIPASVTSIGMRAFGICTNLATVTVYAPSCSLGEDAFASCFILANIYVFSNLVDGYKAAENWSSYANKITALPTVTTSYVDASGTLHDGVEAVPLNNAMTTLPTGTYVVNSDVAYTGTVTLSGNVTLILGDGCTMSFGKQNEPLNATIIECQNHNLTIYGQSGGTGWLKAYSTSDLGINTYNAYTQYSGNVLIRDYSGYCINANNSVTLLGGTLDVESGGILQGDISGGSISILGGKLWAWHNGLWGPLGITLGYTNATDQIYVTIYHAGGMGVQIADGKTLVDDYGVIWSGTLNNYQIEQGINNRTLKPLDYTGVTLTKEDDNVSATFSGSSETTVSIPENVTVTSVTYNRTFTEGKPSTVMLPFSLGEGQTLTGGTLYKFTGVTKNETTGMWEATMTETATLQANTPYLLMPDNELVDGKVTFDLNWGTVTLNTTGGGNCLASDAEGWVFHGTYSKKLWNEVETHDYGFAALSGTSADGQTDVEAGQFVRLTTGASAKPMRCYLSYVGGPNQARALNRGAAATDEELPSSIIVRLVGANGQTTAIGTIDTKTGEMTFDSEAWYTLDGVRLSGKPTQKGLYINNGRKIVIK